MANHASALKAHRQSLSRRARNRRNRSQLRTGLKKFEALLTQEKSPQARESVSELYALVDKAVRKGAMSRNAAGRHKSRLLKRLNKLAATTPIA
ncbi:MAG: 30S ribosomal protein S20 [Acidobacteria bacterium]|nr:30S ribosomal protein S20 [Acidobacteriota bacterium]